MWDLVLDDPAGAGGGSLPGGAAGEGPKPFAWMCHGISGGAPHVPDLRQGP